MKGAGVGANGGELWAVDQDKFEGLLLSSGLGNRRRFPEVGGEGASGEGLGEQSAEAGVGLEELEGSGVGQPFAVGSCRKFLYFSR